MDEHGPFSLMIYDELWIYDVYDDLPITHIEQICWFPISMLDYQRVGLWIIRNHQESSGITIIHHLFFPGPKRSFSKNDHWMYRPLETCDSPAMFVGNRQCHGPLVDSSDDPCGIPVKIPHPLNDAQKASLGGWIQVFSCLNPPYGLVKARKWKPHSLYDSYSIRFFES